MTKVLVMLYKRPDLSWDEFRRYWREVHGPLAVRLPGLRRYIENHSPEPGNPPCGVAELYFDRSDDFPAAIASPVGKAAPADQSNCVDLERTGMTVVIGALTVDPATPPA